MIYFIIPSFLFVFIIYSSFWIDRKAVPARTAMSVSTILITISLYSSVHAYVPDIKYDTLLGNFVVGVLSLAILGMVEFTIVNFCDFTYQGLRTKINEIVEEISFLAKVDDDEEVLA